MIEFSHFKFTINSLNLIPPPPHYTGSVYLHDCTIQDKIPIFLIVFGCVSLLQTCCGMSKMIFCRGNDDENDGQNRRKKGSNSCEGLITTFLFIWVIVGSVYTFSSWGDWVDNGRQSCPAGGDYCCAPVLMYFAFITLLVIYGIAAIACFCLLCTVCVTASLAAASSE